MAFLWYALLKSCGIFGIMGGPPRRVIVIIRIHKRIVLVIAGSALFFIIFILGFPFMKALIAGLNFPLT